MNRKSSLNAETKRGGMQESMKWSPPSKDCLKLNVNASIVMDDSSFVIGMVIRDDRESLYKARTCVFQDWLQFWRPK